jgi:hypothetical protein
VSPLSTLFTHQSQRDLYLVNVVPPPTPSPFDNINNGWLNDGFDRIDTPAPSTYTPTYMPTAGDINDMNAGWAGDAYYGSVSGGTIHYGGTYVTEGSGSRGSFVGESVSGSGKSGKGTSGFGSGKSGKGTTGFGSGKSGKGTSGFSGSDNGFQGVYWSGGASVNVNAGKSGKGSSNGFSGSDFQGDYWSGSVSANASKSGKGSSAGFAGGKGGKSGSNSVNPSYHSYNIAEPTWYSDGYVRTRGNRISGEPTAAVVATPEQLGDRPQSTFKTEETVECREITAGYPAVCVKVCTTIKSIFDGSTLLDESATTTESECD